MTASTLPAAPSVGTAVLPARRRAAPSSVPDAHPVPPIGTARRLRALQAMGYPLSHLASALAVPRYRLGEAFTDVAVDAALAHAVACLYSRIKTRTGPSADLAHRARAAGHPPPWAWHRLAMDNPAVAPWYYGPDVDEVAVERVLSTAHGRYWERPARDLTLDEVAEVVGHILMRERCPAAVLTRVFAMPPRRATRLVSRGGVRRSHAARLTLRPPTCLAG